MFDFITSFNVANFSNSLNGMDQGPIKKEVPAIHLAIEHSCKLGTHVTGDTFTHKHLIKAAGFRWKARARMWGVTNTAGRKANPLLIDKYRYQLEQQGVTVSVSIATEDTAKEREDFLEEKKKRLENKVISLGSMADSYSEKARAISDRIPMGQPVLVGHHSEKRHRKDLSRIRGNYEKAGDCSQKAQATKSRLRKVERALNPVSMTFDPVVESQVQDYLKSIRKRFPLVRGSGSKSKGASNASWVIRFRDYSIPAVRITLDPSRITISDYCYEVRVMFTLDQITEALACADKLFQKAHAKHKPVSIKTDVVQMEASINDFYLSLSIPGERKKFIFTPRTIKKKGLSQPKLNGFYEWAQEHRTEEFLKSLSDDIRAPISVEKAIQSAIGIYPNCEVEIIPAS